MRRYESVDAKKKPLKAEAPYDDWSFLPLPLVRNAGNILYEENEDVWLTANRHHGNYPKRKLRRTLGGAAMRLCGIVRAPYDLHVDFHRYNLGTGGPQTLDEQIVAATLALGGYVPKDGVTIDESGDTRKYSLSIAQRLGLIASGTIQVPDTEALRPFLNECIVKRGLTPAQRAEHRKLLESHAQDPTFCNGLILKASKVAMAVAADKFADAYDAGLLPRANYRDVGEFVCSLLTVRSEAGDAKPHAIPLFQAALAAA